MAAFLALCLMTPQHRGKEEGVHMALPLILFLLVAGIRATDTEEECRVEVLKGDRSLSVPLKEGKAVFWFSPKNTEPLLQNITFQVDSTSMTCEGRGSNCQKKKNEACSWWQKVDLTVKENYLCITYCDWECPLHATIEQSSVSEVIVRNNGEDTRLVAVNCDEKACPIIDSTSMNEIWKRQLLKSCVYARRMNQDAIAVLTNFNNCSVSQDNTKIMCDNCGTTDIWKSQEVCSWVKLTTDEGKTRINREKTVTMIQVVYSSDMEWTLGCKPDTTDSEERTTTQHPLTSTTSLSTKQDDEFTARTQNTTEVAAISDANDACVAYIWITLIALLNTLFLLVLLTLVTRHMTSEGKQSEMDEEEKATRKRMRLKNIMDCFVAFWSSSHSSQDAPSTENLNNSHHNIQPPKNVEDNSQTHAQRPPNLELNTTSNERHKSFPMPALPPLPLSPRSCPATDQLNAQEPLDTEEEEPEYDYIDLPIMPVPPQQQQQPKNNQEALNKVEGKSLKHTQSCPNSESKNTTERQRYSLMSVPPPPSFTPPPCPGTENLNSQQPSSITSEEPEYDYIALPIMPMPQQQQQQPKDNQETSKKAEGESQKHTQPCSNSESKRNTEGQKESPVTSTSPPPLGQ